MLTSPHPNIYTKFNITYRSPQQNVNILILLNISIFNIIKFITSFICLTSTISSADSKSCEYLYSIIQSGSFKFLIIVVTFLLKCSPAAKIVIY